MRPPSVRAAIALLARAASLLLRGAAASAASAASPREAWWAAGMAQHAAALRQEWRATHPAQPADLTAPILKAGAILTPAINAQIAPASPQLSFTYRTGDSGLNAIYYSFTSPQNIQTVSGNALINTYSAAGTLTVQKPEAFSRYAASGNWSLSSVTIFDRSGNYTVYAGAALAAIFPSLTLTVTNARSPDSKKPLLASGQILTPTISLSGPLAFFEAKLAVSDNGSGVYSAYPDYSFVTVTDSKGIGQYFAYAETPAPVLKGTVIAHLPLGPGYPTGSYTITGYQICDAASNCTTSTSAADVKNLFGTVTFVVGP